MNKKSKFLFGVLAASALSLSVAAACHSHTYSEEWSYDDTQHWHQADCGHDEEKTDVGNHTWNDGKITTDAGCETAGVMTYTCTVCGDTKTVAIPATGHNYVTSVEWSDDHTSAKVKGVCQNNASHVIEADAVVTVTDTTTCQATGIKTYTATGEIDGKTVTDTYEEATTSTLAHVYGEPRFIWSSDGTTATARFNCKNCTSFTDVTATVTHATATPAVCETAGTERYTATVTFNGTDYTATNDVAIPALGHDYEVTSDTWNADHSSVDVTLTCKHDSSHTVTKTVTDITSTTTATCTAAGTTTYTAAFEQDGKRFTATATADADALGHDYQAAFKWAGDFSSCNATITCSRCSDTHTVAATVTDNIESDNITCASSGITYTASATYDGTTYTDTKVGPVDKLHDYGNWTIKFTDADDGTVTAVAQRVCKNNSTHVDTRNVKISSTTTATCTEAGTTTYTAEITIDGTELTDTHTVNTPALGHNYGVDWKMDGTGHWKECTRCSAKTDIHTWNEGTVTEESTIIAQGTKVYTCATDADCDAVLTEKLPKTSPALDQTYTLELDAGKGDYGDGWKYNTTIGTFTADAKGTYTVNITYNVSNDYATYNITAAGEGLYGTTSAVLNAGDTIEISLSYYGVVTYTIQITYSSSIPGDSAENPIKLNYSTYSLGQTTDTEITADNAVYFTLEGDATNTKFDVEFTLSGYSGDISNYILTIDGETVEIKDDKFHILYRGTTVSFNIKTNDGSASGLTLKAGKYIDPNTLITAGENTHALSAADLKGDGVVITIADGFTKGAYTLSLSQTTDPYLGVYSGNSYQGYNTFVLGYNSKDGTYTTEKAVKSLSAKQTYMLKLGAGATGTDTYTYTLNVTAIPEGAEANPISVTLFSRGSFVGYTGTSTTVEAGASVYYRVAGNSWSGADMTAQLKVTADSGNLSDLALSFAGESVTAADGTLAYKFTPDSDLGSTVIITNNGTNAVTYVMTIAEYTDEGETPEESALVLGKNNLQVTESNLYNEDGYTFTAETTGYYTITLDKTLTPTMYVKLSDDTTVVGWYEEQDPDTYAMVEGFIESYTFYLEGGASVTFKFGDMQTDNTSDAYTIHAVIGVADTGSVDSLQLGINLIVVSSADVWSGLTGTFTADVAGTYTFTIKPNDDGCVIYEGNTYYGDTEDYSFSVALAAGASITLEFSTSSYNAATYTFTIDYSAAEVNPDGKTA